MKKVFFLYDFYYDFSKHFITIGGIQTYISDLVRICLEEGLEVKVCQMGASNETVQIENYIIEQFKVKPLDYAAFFEKVYEQIDNYTLVIFATETIVPNNLRGINNIGIQHGIYWDIPYYTRKNMVRMYLSKAVRNYKIVRHIQELNTLVCVDYNYVNWLRAETDYLSTNLRVIPNYTKISPLCKKSGDMINIIFARRLFEYRGTRIFTTAIKRILDEYSNVNVTVAGTGPDEGYMKQELSKYNNVEFITYKSEESLQIHANKHIAVVPTVGSEGTSLSLLEAMSAQCAVIASNVGGMTNIILDNYNGLLVNAGDSDDLYKAIKKLLDYPEDRERLSAKAYETVKQAFSYEKWAEKWKEVLSSFIETK